MHAGEGLACAEVVLIWLACDAAVQLQDIFRASHHNKAEAALCGRLVCWVVCGTMLVLTAPGVLRYSDWTCARWFGATVLPSLMLSKAASAVYRGACKPCGARGACCQHSD